ncbi:MAG: MBL fold metallo-hydrolase [Sutterellaceae bacterium]|nr:MBL fold metallo-hydrolase [Burkholderiaceae bacterium]MDW8429089.1 MBL fold metallo-hydrolase [Sutterellaceae bacterium]
MKTTFLGHAALLVEGAGTAVLSDPWWRGPCFGAQWWVYPRPRAEVALARRIPYVYISHGHHDHLHPATLRTLQSGFCLLVSTELDLDDALASVAPVRRLAPDEVVDLGGMTVRIWPTHGDDTLMIVCDGQRVLVNANDALHSAPDGVLQAVIKKLKKAVPAIDYLWCGYGTASHFPNCYRIPGKDDLATAMRRQQYFNERWAWIVACLKPRYAFPFAADVALLESDLIWANEVVHGAERPVEVFARVYSRLNGAVTCIDPAPGFAIEGDQIVNDLRRRRVGSDEIAAEMQEEVRRANDYGPVPTSIVDEVQQLLQAKINDLREFLTTFPGNYVAAIRFRGLTDALVLTKQGRTLRLARCERREGEADVTMVTRAHYLRAALTSEYGHEILFVGSGVRFEYRDAAQARRNLHLELMLLARPIGLAELKRPTRTLATRVKTVVKRIAGWQSRDLYSLQDWVVFR